MNTRCVTNNPMVIDKAYPNTEFIEGDTLSVLIAVKNEVLKGFSLISHPLTSSIRPDINPYKTILLNDSKSKINQDSLKLINHAIEYTKNLMKNNTKPDKWDDKSLKDFQYVDMDIIQNIM